MSVSPSIEETVLKITSRIIRKPITEYQPYATFKDFKADSLDIVQILVAVEETYGIEIPDAELENISNMDSFVSCIKRAIDRKNN